MAGSYYEGTFGSGEKIDEALTNSPTTAQKAALNAANNPSAANPVAVISDLDGNDAETLDGKHYSDIASEIDGDVATHTGIATAHHSNANDPTTEQKAALDAANTPGGSNPFAVINDVNSVTDTKITAHTGIATAHHSNANDPTTDQKAALTAANLPSASNRFIVLSDVEEYLEYIDLLRTQMNTEIIGMEIDSRVDSPLIQIIDRGGDPLTVDADYWHNHVLTSFPRCLVNPDNGNEITMGINDRGDGLAALDGTAGDVMCKIANTKCRVEIDPVTDGHITRMWLAPLSANDAYFENYPGLGPDPEPYTYIGCYEASFYIDGETPKLRSASGKQPVTGGVGYTGLPGDSFTIDNAIQYAQNKGPGWSIPDVWDYASLQGRLYMIAGTMDLQAKYGRGIVDLPSGEGFAGKFTGADGVDALLDVYGCGAGSGNNGQTPVVLNGLENLPTGGNVYEFISGENMMAADGSVRLINPDGTGTPAGTLADGDYIVLDEVVPLAGGYIGSFQATKYGALSWTPATTDGSSSTGAGDYFLYPRYSPSIVLFGGRWNCGSSAGVGCRSASSAPSSSYRYFGARLKFVKPKAI